MNTVYWVEDSAVLTFVYFEHLRAAFVQAARELGESLKVYVAEKLNGRMKGARLGFSSEKELFNICVKLFVALNEDQRHLLSFFWQTITYYRAVSHPITKNENPPCFAQYPTPLLVGSICVKVALRCRGRSYTRGALIQKAVFENNLSTLSKLLTSTHMSVFYCERNQLDSQDNTGLTLAVKLHNEDAVKVLTDAHCSAKLSSMSRLPSPFELACSIKNRIVLEILMASV